MSKVLDNKFIKFLLKFIKVIVWIFVLLVIFVILVQRIFGNRVSIGSYRMFTVVTGSMEPVYNVGDVVISKEVDPSTINKGDDVVYLGEKNDFKDKIVTHRVIKIDVANELVTLTTLNASKEANALYGLSRTLIANMVKGVSEGYAKTLVINGVGYKVFDKGDHLEMLIGFSHPVVVKSIEGVKLSCPSVTEIKVEGADKEKVGQMAANIRAIKPVEPYHAYGVRYADEVVMRKVGKAAGKGAKK